MRWFQVGDTIDVKGPLGHVTYASPGRLLLGAEAHAVKTFVMLCGGTGITPMYQVLCAVLRSTATEDPTEVGGEGEEGCWSNTWLINLMYMLS